MIVGQSCLAGAEEVLAQCGPVVSGAHEAAPLEFRDHEIGEILDVLVLHGMGDVEAIDACFLHPGGQFVGDRFGTAHDDG